MKNSGLFLRAVIVSFLIIAFYAFALATAAAMLYVAFFFGSAIQKNGIDSNLFAALILIVAMVIAAVAILWSIIPRIDRFVPPGPELTRDDQPELFEEIRQIAIMTRQNPPAHVYLMLDMNAFVAERGGWMGLGSKRVMSIGLGLLNTLTVTELRAVIAHEFGHFHNGDTKLYPWIYKTRKTIIRTAQNLIRTRKTEASSILPGLRLYLEIVTLPFEGLAQIYLRITYAMSRAQEYNADKIAVITQGAAGHIQALKKTHRDGQAFEAFIHNDFIPMLKNKFKAPLHEGFLLYLSARNISEQFTEQEQETLEADQPDPYDTHPSLLERIRYAESLNAAIVIEDPRLAVELLHDLPALETLLFEKWTNGTELQSIRWEDYPAAFIPSWKRAQSLLAQHLDQPTPQTLPTSTEEIRQLAAKIFASDFSRASVYDLHTWGAQLYTQALSAMLLDHGYKAFAHPGLPITFYKDDGPRIHFKHTTRQYLFEELSFDEWSLFWTNLGLAHTIFQEPNVTTPLDVDSANEKDAAVFWG